MEVTTMGLRLPADARTRSAARIAALWACKRAHLLREGTVWQALHGSVTVGHGVDGCIWVVVETAWGFSRVLVPWEDAVDWLAELVGLLVAGLYARMAKAAGINLLVA